MSKKRNNSLNTVVVSGILMAEATIKEQGNGNSMAIMAIMIAESKYENGEWLDGEKKYPIEVTCFGGTAMQALKIKRGQEVIVAGKVNGKLWVNKETGVEKIFTGIQAARINVLSGDDESKDTETAIQEAVDEQLSVDGVDEPAPDEEAEKAAEVGDKADAGDIPF